MKQYQQLKYGPAGETSVHICVDMQRMFAEGTEWEMPWLDKVLPNILKLTETAPEQTIFTRFIPAVQPGEGERMWAKYYTRWSSMTLSRLQPSMVELVPELALRAPGPNVR